MQLDEVKEKGTEFVSMQFVDILGNIKSCETTVEHFEDVNESGGLWFDGSSIQGFTRIYESDMFLKPDGEFTLLPWTENKVARIICSVYNRDKTPFEGDPRNILKRNLDEAKKKGFDYFVGPELEFFLFKDMNGATIQPDPHDKGGYFDWSPFDEGSEVKREVMATLQQMGVPMERLSHEVAHGQHEIGFRYSHALEMADRVLLIKSVVKIIAKKHGLYASFMPKPLFGKNGSGMHVHQSLWKNGENAFYGEGNEYNLSETALSFAAGQMKHARAFAGVIAPTVNSYKRLVPGYEAPVYVCWGRVNRSAMIRVPEVHGKKATRIELRCPDASANPYLAFSAMLAAGLDGMENNEKPPAAVEESVYDFDDEKLKKFYVQTLPGSLGEAIEETRKSGLMKKALGEHAFEKHLKAQERQWNEFRLHVTDWEIKTYLPRL
ncbi:MAG TPA: type I glutamate--ammonia ligase [Candidatus Norongarragalinales archaeon]|nr:type I glutamate--ammonia ligase [Candidatus Norongarragalinales archaeon]